MSTHTEVEESKAPQYRRFPPYYSGIMITVSALGLYLLLVMLTWAAPQPDQSETSGQMRWLNSPPATAFSEVRDTEMLFLPMIQRQATPTPPPTPTPIPFPPIQGASYSSIPVNPYDQPDRIDSEHADLNLELRGYALTSAILGLVNYNGATDPNTPRLANLFSPARLPTFLAAYRVYDWYWLAPPNPGYRLDPLTTWPVTLIWMATNTNEIIHLPYHNGDIYQGNYHAQVLYATDDQITIVYTRKGNVITGYTVHIVNIWVDPQLVELYQRCNAAGRYVLPALANGQAFGRAKAGGIGVAIRDNGSFMDPRSRKDWWPGW